MFIKYCFITYEFHKLYNDYCAELFNFLKKNKLLSLLYKSSKRYFLTLNPYILTEVDLFVAILDKFKFWQVDKFKSKIDFIGENSLLVINQISKDYDNVPFVDLSIFSVISFLKNSNAYETIKRSLQYTNEIIYTYECHCKVDDKQYVFYVESIYYALFTSFHRIIELCDMLKMCETIGSCEEKIIVYKLNKTKKYISKINNLLKYFKVSDNFKNLFLTCSSNSDNIKKCCEILSLQSSSFKEIYAEILTIFIEGSKK